jgi:hypothetical protein
MNWSKVIASLSAQAKKLTSKKHVTDADRAAAQILLALANAFIEGNEQYHTMGGAIGGKPI